MHQHQHLVERLQKKDENAFSKLYDAYSAAIYGMILRMCKSEVLAQEILQDTFLTVWEKSSSYQKEKGSFYTWVYRMARNKTLNELRKQKNFIQNEDLSVYKEKKEEEIETINLELKGSINQLEPHHKKAIELVYFNGLTHKEAHKEMEVPLGTFKSYVRQALKKLKENYSNVITILLVLIQGITNG